MQDEKFDLWNRVDAYLLRCGEIREPFRFCVAILEGLADLIEFDQAVLLMHDGNGKVVYKHFIGIPKKWSSLYLEYYFDYPLDEIGIRMDVTEQPGRSFIQTIDWTKLDDSRDEFVINYIRPRGLRHSLTMALFDLDGAPSASFSLDRMEDKPFDWQDVGIMNRIAQHLNNLYKNLLVRPGDQSAEWERLAGAETLTPREREIVDLLCKGVRPANIARKLFISVGTANKHIVHIYRKLGVQSRQELLVKVLGN